MAFLLLVFSCLCFAKYAPNYQELEKAEWALYENLYDPPTSFWQKWWRKLFPTTKKKIIDKFLNQPLGTTREKRSNEVILSFTSFPPRINRVFLMVESLLRQTVKPNRIILYLSSEEFPDKKIPETLKAQIERGLEIRWVPYNYRSYKKLIYALKEYPEAVIINVDDDCFYGPDLVSNLYLEHLQHPKDRLCHAMQTLTLNSKREILPEMLWQSFWNTPAAQLKTSIFSYCIGYKGILYPPHSLHHDVFEAKKFQKLCPSHDDLWFWVMGLLAGTKTRFVDKPLQRKSFSVGPSLSKENCLKFDKCGKGKHIMLTDIKIHNVLSYYDLYSKFNMKPNPKILELSKKWSLDKIIEFGNKKKTEELKRFKG